MPNFGEYSAKIHEIKQIHYKTADGKNIPVQPDPFVLRIKNIAETSKIPRIKDIIGVALDKIGTYNDLNNKEQVVALIDEVSIFRLEKFLGIILF